MNKKTILQILLDLVFVIVFNVVFFLSAGTEHPASVWISYGFIHFSYLMILLTPFLTRKSSSSAVFGFSIYTISSVYFFIEFIVGLVFIFLRQEEINVALIVQIIIAGIYAIMLISNLIANESTADSIEKHENEVGYIKTTASRVKALIGSSSDKKANKEIEKLYDLIHSSPTKSHSNVKSLEIQALNKISDLEQAVDINDINLIIAISREIADLYEQRNRKLRLIN